MIVTFEEQAPKLGSDVFVAYSALVLGEVSIGDQSSIWYGAVLRGDVHWIRIGARTNLQDRCVVHVSTGTCPTVVGNDVTVGHAAVLHGCQVRDHVLVGMGAILLDDAEVHSDSIVAAGALLPPGKRYPPGSLIVGSPARVVRELRPEELSQIRFSSSHYVELARRHATLPGCATPV